uniref:Interleukin 6 receptor n=1 Tax=Coturnix japonica TaxID=93934 RepID=A0A8C2TQH8_COTJA
MARPPGLIRLVVLLLTAASSAPRRRCGPIGEYGDTVLVRPGANVTLLWAETRSPPTAPCCGPDGRGALGGGHDAAWLKGAAAGERPGRSSCTPGGYHASNLRALQSPPGPPRCGSCEWKPRASPAPGTRAVLWVKRRAGGCHFYPRAQKFVCRVKVPPGTDDTKALVVSVCISSRAGSPQASGILPDPPLNVTVEAVDHSPQRLRVLWSYPPSWDPRFYWLRFQVRYRPEPAPTFTHVDQVTRTWLDIRDAWRGTRHVVQVRAQEEFGHGAWSEWSQEAVGTPWTEPWDVTEMGPYSSQFPAEDDPYGYGATLPPELFADDAADGAGGAVLEATARSPTSPYALLVAGGSLLLAIALYPPIPILAPLTTPSIPPSLGFPAPPAPLHHGLPISLFPQPHLCTLSPLSPPSPFIHLQVQVTPTPSLPHFAPPAPF